MQKLDSDDPVYDPGYRDEECDYCWQQATRQRFIPDDGRYVYCAAHAPADAIPNGVDDARAGDDED